MHLGANYNPRKRKLPVPPWPPPQKRVTLWCPFPRVLEDLGSVRRESRHRESSTSSFELTPHFETHAGVDARGRAAARSELGAVCRARADRRAEIPALSVRLPGLLRRHRRPRGGQGAGRARSRRRDPRSRHVRADGVWGLSFLFLVRRARGERAEFIPPNTFSRPIPKTEYFLSLSLSRQKDDVTRDERNARAQLLPRAP